MEMGLVVAVLCGLAGVGVLAAGAREGARARRRRADAYLEEVIAGGASGDEADEFTRHLARPFVERVVRPQVGRVVRAVSSITPSDHRARVRDRLGRAGMDDRVRPEDVIAAQGAGFLLGLLAGLGVLASDRLGAVTSVAVVVVLAAAGGAAPLAWLTRRVEQRTSGIRRDLPETLDLLAISVEAGLGLEGAMAVVVEQDPGPLGRELSRTLQEMELGLSRRDALTHLKQRAQVTELSTFVQALVQADILGMPLARVLKVQADEMRLKRRQWARERAAKLPVKILFPLVACIFPAILVVILGPAISQIGSAL